MNSDPTFPRITAHDLLHTASSLAVSAGANVKAIQRMMGHKSAAMTLDVYADLFSDDLDVGADRLEQSASKCVQTRCEPSKSIATAWSLLSGLNR